MQWKFIESKNIVNEVKILVHYIHHFANIKNIYFHVGQLPVEGQSPWISNNRGRMQQNFNCEYNIKVSLSIAKTENKRKEQIPHDMNKLCSLLELCPDIVLTNKVLNGTGQTTYSVEKVSSELNFIRSDFFKK